MDPKLGPPWSENWSQSAMGLARPQPTSGSSNRPLAYVKITLKDTVGAIHPPDASSELRLLHACDFPDTRVGVSSAVAQPSLI